MPGARSLTRETSVSIRQEASITNEDSYGVGTRTAEITHRTSSRNDKNDSTVSTRTTAYVHVAALDSTSWAPDEASSTGSIDCAVNLEPKQVKDKLQQTTSGRLRRFTTLSVVLVVISVSVLVPIHLIVGFTPRRPLAASTVLQSPTAACKLVFALRQTDLQTASEIFHEQLTQQITEWIALPSSGIHVATFGSHEAMRQAAAQLAASTELRYLVSDFHLEADRKLQSIVNPDKLLELSSSARNLLQQKQGLASTETANQPGSIAKHTVADQATVPSASRLAVTHSRRLAERKAKRRLLGQQRQLVGSHVAPLTARQGQQLQQRWVYTSSFNVRYNADDCLTAGCAFNRTTSAAAATLKDPCGSVQHSGMLINCTASDGDNSSQQRRLQQYQEQPPSPEPQPQQRQAVVQPQRGGSGVAWHLLDPALKAKEAWNITYGLDEIVVAVIDSGIELSHGSVGAAVWANAGEVAADGLDNDGNGYVDDVMGWDFGGSCADAACTACIPGPDPSDVTGWGTHHAAVIAAQPEVTAGSSGLAPGVRVMALKVSDCSAGLHLGDYGSQQLAEGFKSVVNSGTQSSSEEAVAAGPMLRGSAALQALDYAWSNGAHVVLAAWQAGSLIDTSTPGAAVSSDTSSQEELMPCALGEGTAAAAGLQAGLATAETAAACLASVQRLVFEDALKPLDQAGVLVITMQQDDGDDRRSSSSASIPCALGLEMTNVLCVGPSKTLQGDPSGLDMRAEAFTYFGPLLYTMNRNLTAEAEERNEIASPANTSNSGTASHSQSAYELQLVQHQMQLRAPASNILAGWAWGSHAVVSGGSSAAAVAAGAAALTWSALGQAVGAAAAPGALEGLGHLVKRFLLAGSNAQQASRGSDVEAVLLEFAAADGAAAGDLDMLQTVQMAAAYTGPLELQPSKVGLLATTYSNSLSYSWYIATALSGAYTTADMRFVYRRSLTYPFLPLSDWEFYGDASLVEIEGYLVVDDAGNYSIAVTSDDRFVVWLEDKWLMMQQTGDTGTGVGLPDSAWVVGVDFRSAGLYKLRIIVYSPFSSFDLKWRLPGSNTFTNPTQFASLGHVQPVPQHLQKQVTRHMLLSSSASHSRGTSSSSEVVAKGSEPDIHVPVDGQQSSAAAEVNNTPESVSDGSSVLPPAIPAPISHIENPSAFYEQQADALRQRVMPEDQPVQTQPGYFSQASSYTYPGLFGFGGFSSFLDSISGYARGWERGSRTDPSDNTDTHTDSSSSSSGSGSGSSSSSGIMRSQVSASSVNARSSTRHPEVPKPSRLLLSTEDPPTADTSSALPGVFSVAAALVPPSEYRTILPGLPDLQFTHTGVLSGPGLEIADNWQLQQQLLGYTDAADDRAVYGVVQGWVDWQAANSEAYSWLEDTLLNETSQLGQSHNAGSVGLASAGVVAASAGVQFELTCSSAATQTACALHIDGHAVVGALDETQQSSCVVPARRLLPVSRSTSSQQSAVHDAMKLQRHMHVAVLFAAGDMRAVTLAVKVRPCRLDSNEQTGFQVDSSSFFTALVAAPGASAYALSAAAVQDTTTGSSYQQGMVCTVTAEVPATAANASTVLEKVVHLSADQLQQALAEDHSITAAPGFNGSSYNDTRVEPTAKAAAALSGISVHHLAPDWAASLPTNTVFGFTCGCYWNGSWAGNVSVGVHAGDSGSAALYLAGWPVAASTTLPLYGPSDIDISLYSSWLQQQQLMSGSRSADALEYQQGEDRIAYAQQFSSMSAESRAAAMKLGYRPAELLTGRGFTLGEISGAGAFGVPIQNGWFQLLVLQSEGLDSHARVVVAAAALTNPDSSGDNNDSQSAVIGWLPTVRDAWVPRR